MCIQSRWLLKLRGASATLCAQFNLSILDALLCSNGFHAHVTKFAVAPTVRHTNRRRRNDVDAPTQLDVPVVGKSRDAGTLTAAKSSVHVLVSSPPRNGSRHPIKTDVACTSHAPSSVKFVIAFNFQLISMMSSLVSLTVFAGRVTVAAKSTYLLLSDPEFRVELYM